MLELIVLGEIPGTDIVLTLPWVLTLTALFGVLFTVRSSKQSKELHKQVILEEITL